MKRRWWFWLQLLIDLFQKERPMPPDPPTDKQLIRTMIGADSTIVVDTDKLTADQVVDDAAHSDFGTRLAAKPDKKTADLADDGSSVTIYRLNPDGITFSTEKIDIAM